MSDKSPDQRSFLGELFSLADEAAGLAKEVRSPVAVPRPARHLDPEPYDAAIVHVLRALVMECVPHGGVRVLLEEGQFRVIIGEGISMRVTEGPTLGGAILKACEREGISLDAAGPDPK